MRSEGYTHVDSDPVFDMVDCTRFSPSGSCVRASGDAAAAAAAASLGGRIACGVALSPSLPPLPWSTGHRDGALEEPLPLSAGAGVGCSGDGGAPVVSLPL